jgi:hypothetical protein
VGGTCSTHEEGRDVYRVLVRTPEVKRPVGRPRRRWEDNIKMDHTEIRIDGENCIQLTQDRIQWRAFVSTVMNLWAHKESSLLLDKLSHYQLFKEYPAPWSK